MWRMGLKWFGESHIASVRLKRSYRNSDYCDCVFWVGNRAGIIKINQAKRKQSNNLYEKRLYRVPREDTSVTRKYSPIA